MNSNDFHRLGMIGRMPPWPGAHAMRNAGEIWECQAGQPAGPGFVQGRVEG